jgi:hypothetical protein
VIPRKPLLFLVFFIAAFSLSASEISDGFLRLILNERTGRFSIYFLFDPGAMRYEALFNTSVPSSSFLSVNVDGRVYHLGESRTFRTSYERLEGNPALVFESSFLKVSEIFSPVKTSNSSVVNGVMITINIENKNSQRLSVGLRMLIDTHLGEGRGRVPFITNSQIITNETLIEGASGERFWISRGDRVTLMGSILSPLNNSIPPDFVHIANWKRLNDVPWRLRYYEGRSFNNIPYSIGDSAVCYYYEPAVLDGGRSFAYTIFLTTEDISWYNGAITPEPVREAPTETPRVIIEAPTINFAALEESALREAANNEDSNMLLLLKLQALLDQFLAGDINLNERDLTEIERSINRLRNIY